MYINGTTWWTITPDEDSSGKVWDISSNGSIFYNLAYTIFGIRPVVHLTSEIKLSGSGTEDAPYKITYIKVEETVNGTVDYTVDSGTVTITTTPDEGYELDSITVTDPDGNTITVNENQFNLPDDGVVVINATFKLVNSQPISTVENPETYDDILPYFVLSAVSIIGLISIGIYFRKNMKNKTR